MKSRLFSGFAVMLAMIMGNGCSTSHSAALDREDKSAVLTEAPLGSRIKKRSNIAPISGTTREEMEQARAQAGAVATGIVNRNP